VKMDLVPNFSLGILNQFSKSFHLIICKDLLQSLDTVVMVAHLFEEFYVTYV